MQNRNQTRVQASRCKRLMRRVILNALEDIRDEKTYRWFFCENSGYEDACDMADWDYEEIQEKIRMKFKNPEVFKVGKVPKLKWKGQTLSILQWAKVKNLGPTGLRNRYLKYLKHPETITIPMVFGEVRMAHLKPVILDSVKIEYENKTQTLREWQEEKGLTASCILNRYTRWQAGAIDLDKFFHKGYLPGWKGGVQG